MSLNISDVKISETKKRIDAKVEQSDFWNGTGYTFTLRILSKEEIDETVRDLVEQVIRRKSSWRQGKKSQSLQLDGLNATAYIINFKDSEDE